MRYFIVMSVFVALLNPGIASAKRMQAAKVEPVIHEGMRYVAPNDDGRRGYIQAWNTNTGQMMWEVTIFQNSIDPSREEDVQWVFIKKSLADGKLVVVTERGLAYSVDLKTRAVKPLKPAPPEKPRANKSPQATRVGALCSASRFTVLLSLPR